MHELICGIVGLTFLVLLITFVGHGLWLLGAAIGKALAGEQASLPANAANTAHSENDTSTTPRPCRRCGSGNGVVSGRCRYCGAIEPAAANHRLRDEITATQRQLDRLWRRGIMNDEEHDRLLAACARDLERLSGQAPATVASTPVTAPSAVAKPALVAKPPVIIEDDVADQIHYVTAEVVEKPIARPPSVAKPQPPIHPLDRVDEPVAHSPPSMAVPRAFAPPVAKRALADVLASFMQERNIRWGELVSGLLIVGSAAGLVISLRATLQNWIPYFPALLFLLVTAAIHAAGIYTLRRWNLRTTSRGVLLIVQLLVPLNFLAAIVIRNQQLPVTSPAYLAAISIGLLSYSAICYSGAKALLGARWFPTALTVLGASASQLFIHRLLPSDATQQQVLLLAALPFGSLIVAMLLTLWQGRNWKAISYHRAAELLFPLGLGSFALLMPLILIVSKADERWQAIADLAPLVALTASMLVAVGLFMAQRTRARSLAAVATTGTALAIFGGVAMVGAVLLAWPLPGQLIAVGALCCMTLALLAFLGRLPLLHWPAIACAALVSVIGFHLWQGTFDAITVEQLSHRIVEAWWMGRSAVVLTALGIVVAMVAGLAWKTQREHAECYAWGAAGLGVFSLLIAAWAGFQQGDDGPLATPLFAFYAALLAIAAFVRPLRPFTWGAAALSLVAIVHALAFNQPVIEYLRAQELLIDRPVLLAVLCHANVLALAALAAWWWRRDRELWRGELIEPLAQAAVVGSVLATWFAVVVRDELFARHAGYTVALAVVWVIAAVIHKLPPLFSIAQALLSLALVYVAIAGCQMQDWWISSQLDARTVYVVAATLAVWCVLWATARRATERFTPLQTLINPPWPAVDQAILTGLVMVLLTIPGMAAWKNIDAELATKTFDLAPRVELALAHASSPLVWIAWGLIGAALVASLWERISLGALCGLILLGITPCMLLAIDAQAELASASMLRWSLAGYCAIATALICLRAPLKRAIFAVPGLFRGDLPEYSTPVCIGIVTLRTALPVVGLTLTACSLAAQGIAPRGPLPETFFHGIGWSLSYGVPLAVLVLVSLAMAIRERQPAFATVGALLWQFVVTLACVMPVLTTGGSFTTALWASVLVYNALGLTTFTLLWLTLQPWLMRPTKQDEEGGVASEAEPLLVLQLSLMILSLVGLGGWAAGLIIWHSPGTELSVAAVLGSPLSFVALAMGAGAVLWFGVRRGAGDIARRELPSLLLLPITATVPVIAAALRSHDLTLPWLSFHSLIGGWNLLAIGLLAVVSWIYVAGEQQAQRIAAYRVQGLTWGLALASVTLVLTLCTAWNDPIDWWPALQVLAMLLAITALGTCSQRHEYGYLTTPLALFAASLLWFSYWPAGTLAPPLDFLALNMLAAIVINAWWLAVDVYRQRNTTTILAANWLVSPVRVFTPLVTFAFAALIALAMIVSLVDGHTYATTSTHIVLAVMLGAYLVGTLWHGQVATGLPMLYLWGLMVAIMPCDRIPPPGEYQIAGIGVAVSAFVALTGLLWHNGAKLSLLGQNLGIRDVVHALERTCRWLPAVTLLLATMIVLLELDVVLVFEPRVLRFAAGFAPLLLAFGVGAQAQQQRRSAMLYLSLLLGSIAAVYLGWADLPHGLDDELWLRRAIRLLTVLGAMAFVYGALFTRAWSHIEDWITALRQMALTCGGGAGFALMVILVIEVGQFQPGQNSPIDTPQVLIVALVLALLAAALVVLAIYRGAEGGVAWLTRDDQRMACVYGAQLVLALAFGHLYLTRSVWFDGLLRPYWPFVVMALAFGGVGISEWMQRLKQRVLAEPLQMTSMFLPLIPAIGWWIEALRGEPTTDYALVMFVVGLLYVIVSALRQSTTSAIFAGVAGNIALWSLMHDSGFNFTQHPQFWLIPPAVCVLAAAQVQQRRLSAEQLAAARYLCMLVIYLSSTSEIFITGIGDSLWQPMALATLAVLGVIAGIVLQVRAFLYLGTSFVFLAVVTMVWHAAQSLHHVWPWWAFGICLGLAILVFFGLFEKKKVEITAFVDRLRQWEP